MGIFDTDRIPMAATCSRGLEEVLAEEVRGIGGKQVEASRGAVAFSGSLETLFAANLCLRTAVRVLVPLATGAVDGRRSLYRLASGARWEKLIGARQSFMVDVAGTGSGFANTSFAGQVVKDAVVDRIRARRGSRPNVDRKNPDVRVNLHLAGRQTTVSLDASGEPLPHRGYRPRGGPAPLSEALAAGMLLLAGYDGSAPLVDPMCGTGTIIAEAALIAGNIAPGLERTFAFERWPSFEKQTFDRLKEKLRGRRRRPRQLIIACDAEPKAVGATKRNLEAAGIRGVRVQRRDLSDLTVPVGDPGLIVSNPPYGKRVGEVEALRSLFKTLGDRLKQHCAGWTAWLLLGERELANEIGLKTTCRIPLFNGPIECRLMRFDLYKGTKKNKTFSDPDPDPDPDPDSDSDSDSAQE